MSSIKGKGKKRASTTGFSGASDSKRARFSVMESSEDEEQEEGMEEGRADDDSSLVDMSQVQSQVLAECEVKSEVSRPQVRWKRA